MRTKGFLRKISCVTRDFRHHCHLWNTTMNYHLKQITALEVLCSPRHLDLLQTTFLGHFLFYFQLASRQPLCHTRFPQFWLDLPILSQTVPAHPFFSFSFLSTLCWNLLVFLPGLFSTHGSLSHLIQAHGSTYHFLTDNSRISISSPELSLELVSSLLDIVWKSTPLAADLYTSGPKSEPWVVLSRQTSSGSCAPSLGRWHQIRHIKFSLSFSAVLYLN